ncbi:MAG: HAD hydrolase family protein [Acidobacteriota bacterium]|nr:HAD hydrolase family protein [Acidobacteriota bacterium]
MPHQPTAATPRALDDETFRQRARGLAWLLTDVDGVLTDGRMVYGPEGEETKRFHARDGLALKLARRCGIQVGLLSARGNRAVEVRAGELGLDRVLLGQGNKVAALESLLEETGVPLEAVAFIGDDLPDLGVLGRVGLALCPADAATEVRQLAHRVLHRPGGQGCVREAVEAVLQARGQWQEAIAPFYQD